MLDRRATEREPVDVFFNKFLQGQPYLCRSIDLSATGLLAETFTEPTHIDRSFSLELKLPGVNDSVWIWARSVWRRGNRQAFRFMNIDGEGRGRLERYLLARAVS